MAFQRIIWIISIAFLAAFSNKELVFAKNAIVIAAPSTGGPADDVVRALQDHLNQNQQDIKVVSFEKGSLTESGEIINNLKKDTPSLIVAVGTGITKLIQHSSINTPVVFTMVLGPERSGISPPGVSMDIPYLFKLKQAFRILGHKSRVGIIYSSHSESELQKASDACGQLGCQVIPAKINSDKDFPEMVHLMMETSDMVLMIADPIVYFPKSVEFLLTQALENTIPVIGLSSAYTKAGAILSFDCDYQDLGRQTADLVEEVLKDKEVSVKMDPEKFVYSINIQVAKRMNIRIPDEWLQKAEKVYGE